MQSDPEPASTQTGLKQPWEERTKGTEVSAYCMLGPRGSVLCTCRCAHDLSCPSPHALRGTGVDTPTHGQEDEETGAGLAPQEVLQCPDQRAAHVKTQRPFTEQQRAPRTARDSLPLVTGHPLITSPLPGFSSSLWAAPSISPQTQPTRKPHTRFPLPDHSSCPGWLLRPSGDTDIHPETQARSPRVLPAPRPVSVPGAAPSWKPLIPPSPLPLLPPDT